MKLVIPVAGLGTRLQPHTFSIPKSLMHVAGKPILGHILDMFKPSDFEEVIFIIGHMGDKIQSYVLSHYSFKTRFIVQREPLGLGHAIYEASSFFGHSSVLIILGDTILDFDVKKFMRSKQSVLGVKYIDSDVRKFGVAITGNNRSIKKLIEKPDLDSGLALVGIYLIHNAKLLSEILEKMIAQTRKGKKEYQFTEALQKMIEKGHSFTTMPIDGWFDCGGLKALLATNHYLLSRNSSVPDNVRKKNIILEPVNIHKSCEVYQSIIGPYATIAEGARITKCHISNSIIENNAVVTDCLLEDSLIGSNAILKGNKINLNIGHSSVVELG
jgi:glucose-1-phosphate thymidylyltransferase